MTTSHSDPLTNVSFYPTRALVVARELGDPEFVSWLAENWLLWGEFVSLALLVKARGRGRWSADAICHVLRWNREVRDQSDATFKVNNNRTAMLGRLFNACAGERFFETRRRHGEREADVNPLPVY